MIPPGLEGDLTEILSGGKAVDWLPFEKKKLYTNAFITKDDKILLGMKKRGFGKGKYNGFGGKVDPGETSAQAAARELREEAGIDAPLKHCGVFLFMAEGAEWAFHIDIYHAEEYSGVLEETDEMRPEWFAIPPEHRKGVSDSSIHELPPIAFDKMWEGDSLWFPFLLSNQFFVGRTDFATLNEGVYKLQRWWFGKPNI